MPLLKILMAFFVVALMPVAGAQQPTATPTPTPVPDNLADAIRAEFVAAGLGPKAAVSVHVMQTGSRRNIVEIEADRPRKPASLLKLATMAAALDLLGPDDMFTTVVETDGVVEKGILYGDIILKGGGDPSLGPRFSRDPQNTAGILDEWALELKKRGIKVVDGNILGDGTRYENERISRFWEQRDLAEWYSAEVSALCYNDNVHDILWKAGDTGSRPSFEAVPRTTYFSINSSVRVGDPTMVGSRIRLFRFPESNEIRARGLMPPKSTRYELAAMNDPAAWTAHLFMERLEEQGIEVKGTALNRVALQGFDAAQTTDTLTLIEHVSPPLRDMLPIVLGESQNLYAEVFLREIARVMREPTTFMGGGAALTNWLREKRLHRTGFLATDGSGLGSFNRMTARHVTDLLEYMKSSRDAELWRSSLASPGSRSMRSRMQESEFRGIAPRLLAKTGYVTGSHTLAGYLTAHNGKEYAFAIMVVDYEPALSLEARDLVDRIVLIMDESKELN